MAHVFVSHASEDSNSAELVRRWLLADDHDVFLARAEDDGIALGEAWQELLYGRLRWADAVVCLVSEAYRNSTWCTAEMAIAHEQGRRILPVLIEPGPPHPLVASLQHTDYAGDPEAARTAILGVLRRLDAGGGRAWPDHRSPFPGLLPFDTHMHRAFFGRRAEADRIAAALRSPLARTEPGVLVVVGPSGCGKSSLVRAGVVPLMTDEPGWWTLPSFVPGSDPVRALAREMTAAGRRVGLDWTQEYVLRALVAEEDLSGLVDELLFTVALGRSRRLLIVVDQLEELITVTPPEQRARFAALIGRALAGPVQVLATTRPEMLAQLLASAEFSGVPLRPHALRPLDRQMLSVVIEEPAKLAGIEADRELVARLVADAGSGEALPLLAYTLAELAEGVGRGGALSPRRYQELGGVSGSLVRQADAALVAAQAATGRSAGEVIGGLLGLVRVDENGSPTRRRVVRADLPEPVRGEIDAFVARGLLTVDEDASGVAVVEVAHEAVFTAWPPLAEAIGSAASALRAAHVLEQAAAHWEQAGRLGTRLWTGKQLAGAMADIGARRLRRQGLVTDKVDLSEAGRSFLAASRRVDRRRRTRTLTALSILLVLALAGASLAYFQQRAAQTQRREAEAQRGATETQRRLAITQQLIARADAATGGDPRLAARLGLAALAVSPEDAQARANLIRTVLNGPAQASLHSEISAVSSVAFAPDGNTLATAGEDNTLILWDLTDRDHPTRLGTPSTSRAIGASSVAFAPDGRTLAATTDTKAVLLWDLADRAHPVRLGEPLTAHRESVNAVAFAPDGRTLATAGADDTVILWDLADRSKPRPVGSPLTAHTGNVLSVAFAPDGRTLATASADDTVILWDVADRNNPRAAGPPLTGHTDDIGSVAFAPDGRTLATASEDNTVILWDLTDRTRPTRLGASLTGHTDDVTSVVFAPVGNTLATASSDRTVLRWDLTDRARPARIGTPLTGHRAPVLAQAFAPDGRTLATSSADDSVMLWEVVDRTPPTRIAGPLQRHTDQVLTVAFAADGRTLATASADRTTILWDLTDRTHPTQLGAPLTGHADAVVAVAFAADGRTIATAGADRIVILWDLTDRTRPARLGEPLTGFTDDVTTMAFAPDGKTLVTATFDSKMYLWDLADRAEPKRLGAPVTSPADGLFSIAFAPDGHTLAVGGGLGGGAVLWDLVDPSRPNRIAVTESTAVGAVVAVAFAPDGHTLLTSSIDGAVTLWDLADRSHPTVVGAPLTGPTDAVVSLAFPHGSPTLATGSLDGSATLWDLTDRTDPIRLGPPLKGEPAFFGPLAISADGRTLATIAEDSTVLWDLTAMNAQRENIVDRACVLADGGLTNEEWSTYVTGLPYQKTCPERR